MCKHCGKPVEDFYERLTSDFLAMVKDYQERKNSLYETVQMFIGTGSVVTFQHPMWTMRPGIIRGVVVDVKRAKSTGVPYLLVRHPRGSLMNVSFERIEKIEKRETELSEESK